MLELTPRYGFLFLCHVRTEHLFLWPSSQVLEFLSPKCYVLTGVFLSAGAICISSITGIQRSEYRGLCGRPTYSSTYCRPAFPKTCVARPTGLSLGNTLHQPIRRDVRPASIGGIVLVLSTIAGVLLVTAWRGGPFLRQPGVR